MAKIAIDEAETVVAINYFVQRYRKIPTNNATKLKPEKA